MDVIIWGTLISSHSVDRGQASVKFFSNRKLLLHLQLHQASRPEPGDGHLVTFGRGPCPKAEPPQAPRSLRLGSEVLLTQGFQISRKFLRGKPQALCLFNSSHSVVFGDGL